MPRPAPAQLVYGTVTVVCSTLVLLVLFEARSALATLLVTAGALVSGLLVALVVPGARGRSALRRRSPTRAGGGTRSGNREGGDVAGSGSRDGERACEPATRRTSAPPTARR